MTNTIMLGDLSVQRLGFGALRLSPQFTEPLPDRESAIKVARRAVELGVTFIDTADAYGLGANEELLAEALHPYADDLVIGTKVGNTRPSPHEWVPCGQPQYLRQQVHLCLQRLRMERLDLLQLHRVDPAVPLEDQVGTLAELRTAGYIRHIGLSEVTVDQLVAAREIVDIVSVQNLYNLGERRSEDLLDYCTSEGIAFLPWRPVADQLTDHTVIDAVATELGATPSQVVLAWMLRRSPVMLPIPGTSSIAHLEENVAAAELTLTDEQYARLG